jgi:hypothetical protein
MRAPANIRTPPGRIGINNPTTPPRIRIQPIVTTAMRRRGFCVFVIAVSFITGILSFD